MRTFWTLFGLFFLGRAVLRGPGAVLRLLARRQVRRSAYRLFPSPRRRRRR